MSTLDAAQAGSRVHGGLAPPVTSLPSWMSLSRLHGVALLHVAPGVSGVPRRASALAEVLRSICEDASDGAIVLKGPAAFIGVGGEADLAELLELVAGASVPVVAAISGPTFGAGLELALACRARVAAPAARFGWPNIRQGYLPAPETVARLARLLDLPDAAELLGFGGAVSADAAHRCGLVDALAADVVAAAIAAALAPPARLPRAAATRRQSAELRASFERRAPLQAAPLAALKALEEARRLPAEQAMGEIARVADGLADSGQGRLMRRAAAIEVRALYAPSGADAPELRSVRILGANAAALAPALAAIGIATAPDADLLIGGAATGHAWRAALAEGAGRICVAVHPHAPMPPGVDAARAVALHLHAPAGRLRLAEVTPAPSTAPATTAALLALLRRAAIPTLLRPDRGAGGVLVDRLRWPMLREAVHLLDEGASPRQIDAALHGWGFAVAPLAAVDREGLDALAAACLHETAGVPAWLHYSSTLDMMLDCGRLGVGGGRGFYRYQRDQSAPIVDPDLERLLRDSAMSQRLRRTRPSEAEIVERCLLAAINAAAVLLDAGESPEAIDAVWTAILAFPRWRGGLLIHADATGLPETVASLRRLHAATGTIGAPAPRLVALAEAGRGLAAS